MAVRAIPVFPVGTVLFPYAELPLHVFEPRYRLMMRHVLDGDREFGVVLIERGSEVGGGDVRFDVGTVASLTRAEELPDGRWLLVTVGMQRFRVVEWMPDDPYPRARVEDLADAVGVGVGVGTASSADAHVARDALAASLRAMYDELARFDQRASEVHVVLSDDPVRASYEAARLAPLGALDAQRVLECDDAVARMGAIGAAVDEQLAVLRRQPPPAPDDPPSGGDTLPP